MNSECTALALRPACKRHGATELRPLLRQTPEQRFCGVWYDCTRCGSSVLYPSKELEAELRGERKIK